MLTVLLSMMLATSTPADQPSAWFFEDPAKAQWCAFKSPAALESFAKALDLTKTKGGPGYGWVQLSGGRISTVMVETVTDEATLDDQYLFDAKGKVTEMLRSAHLVGGEDWATFAYRPTAAGGMALAGKPPKAADQPLAQWPTFSTFEDLPFADLMVVKAGKAQVKDGCARTPAKRNRAG